jgi:hypothetical protein
MIINTDKLKEFERSEIARKDITYEDALVIFDNLRQEAISLGALTCENILDGLDVDIRIARAVNGLR